MTEHLLQCQIMCFILNCRVFDLQVICSWAESFGVWLYIKCYFISVKFSWWSIHSHYVSDLVAYDSPITQLLQSESACSIQFVTQWVDLKWRFAPFSDLFVLLPLLPLLLIIIIIIVVAVVVAMTIMIILIIVVFVSTSQLLLLLLLLLLFSSLLTLLLFLFRGVWMVTR